MLAATLTALPNDNKKVAAAQEEAAATAAQEATAAAEEYVFDLEQKLESETGSRRRMSELESEVEELRCQLEEFVSKDVCKFQGIYDDGKMFGEHLHGH